MGEISPWIKYISDIILGMQDGIVTVLGLTLGLVFANSPVNIILVAGLSTAFAESISMGAVAFTSTVAKRVYLKGCHLCGFLVK